MDQIKGKKSPKKMSKKSPNSDKKKLKGTKIQNVNKQILENFYKLSHPNLNVRLVAARSSLKLLQTQLKKSNEIGTENLNYCVQRLVAGLASPRDASRNGYGVLLLEILESIPLSLDRVVGCAEQKIGHVTKEAKKDVLIGWYLLINIILKSGKLKKSDSASTVVKKIYSNLMLIMNVKSYMEIPVAKTLRDYSEIFINQIESSLPRSLMEADARTSPIDLLKALLCQKHCLNVPQLEILNLSKVASIIEVTASNGQNQGQILHPLILELTEFVLLSHQSSFGSFCIKVLHPIFFIENHHDLAINGLSLIGDLLRENEHLQASHVPSLLNEHVVRLLVISLRHNKLKSREWFSQIINWFESSKNLEVTDEIKRILDIQFEILNTITNYPGSMAFDVDSRTSTLHDLLTNSNSYILSNYLQKIHTLLTEKHTVATSVSQGVEKKRQISQQNLIACVSQLSYIVKRPQMIDEVEKIKFFAVFSLLHSHFKVNEAKIKVGHMKFIKPEFEYDQEARSALKSALHSILEHVTSGAIFGPLSTVPNLAAAEHFGVSRLGLKITWLDEFIGFIDDLTRLSNSEKINFISENENWPPQFISRYRKFIKKTDAQTKEDKRKILLIILVYQFVGLLSIVEDFGLDWCKMQLDDLEQCLHKVIGKKPCDDEQQFIWADVLTDILLFILSTENCIRMVRRFVEIVFSDLVQYTTTASFVQLRDAIMKSADLHDAESDSDDENAENNRKGTELEEKLNSDDDSDGYFDDAMSSEDDVANNNMKNDGEDDNNEDCMDDEQMLKLDGALAEIVKSRKAQIAGHGDGDNSASTAFRLRVLELVKIALKKLGDKKNKHRKEHSSNHQTADLQEFKSIVWPALVKLSQSGAKIDRPLVEKVKIIFKASRNIVVEAKAQAVVDAATDGGDESTSKSESESELQSDSE